MKSTLALHMFPTRSIARDAGLILGGAALTAACAQVSIPFFPVPLTLQTFAVLLVAIALGSKRGFLAQVAYIAAGASGLPVFAGYKGGVQVLFGTTGGYLIGFALAALLVGFLAEKGWDRKFWSTLSAMALGSLVILTCGTIWLAGFIGWNQAVATGAICFVLGDLAKCLAAAFTLPTAWKSMNR